MTDAKIKEIYQDLTVPKHIRRHMKKVATVAAEICDRLISQGEKIDKTLVIHAALLHDCLKYVDFPLKEFTGYDEAITRQKIATWRKNKSKYEGQNHEQAMTSYLLEIGEAKLAHIISLHGINQVPKLKTFEEKILNYADKLVEFDRVVKLEERFKGIKKRYPDFDPDLLKEYEEQYKQLESELA